MLAAIVVRTGPDGAIDYLRILHRVELAATDYLPLHKAQRRAHRHHQRLSIAGCQCAPGVAHGMHARPWMPWRHRAFPLGVHYSIPFDTTLFVSESIHEVVVNC